MDPFEEKIEKLLTERYKVADRIVKACREKEVEDNFVPIPIVEEEEEDRLPYSVSKTVQFLKTEEYLRNKKSLKKQKEVV